MQICEAIKQNKVIEREKLMTGIPAIDSLTNGMYTGEVTCIMGNCNSGKTSLLVAIANELSFEKGQQLLFYQMFGSHQRLYEYLVSYACDIPILDLYPDTLEPGQIDRIKMYKEKLENAPFYLGKRHISNIEDIRYALDSFKKRGTPIKVVIIDDIFLVDYECNKGRHLGYDLHQIAEEYNCAIVVTVETYQTYEREGLCGITPHFRDCYEFGLDTYSDVVLSMINFEEWDIYQDERGNDLQGVIELRLMKKLGENNKFRVRVYQKMLASKEKILEKMPSSLQPIIQGLDLEPVSEPF